MIYIYLIIFLNGVGSLLVEILGSRILAPFYASTIFVWTALISVALGSLSLGYWLGGKIFKKPNVDSICWVFALASISPVATYSLKDFIFNLSEYFSLATAPVVASILLFLPAFILFGIVTPLSIRVINVFFDKKRDVSGNVFALGTLGSLFGGLMTAYFLIPNFSTIQILTGMAVLNVFVAGLFIKDKLKFFLLFVCFVFIYFLTRNFNYAGIEKYLTSAEVIYERSNYLGDFKIINSPNTHGRVVCFLLDYNNQGCIDKDNKIISYQKYVASIVSLTDLGSRILILGAGMGGYIKYWDDPSKNFDILDLNPNTLDMFDVAELKLDPSRHKFINQEARYYIRTSKVKYDLIYNDLLVNVSPVSHVYTKEFNDLIKSKLTKDGIFATHIIGKADGSDKLVNDVISTLKDSFPSVAVLSETPSSHYSYVLILGLSSNEKIVEINSSIKQNFPEGEIFMTYPYNGSVITDDKNTVEFLWAKNIQAFYSSKEFIEKYKKITVSSY